MLEAVCMGQLAQLSQHGPSEAKVEADTVAGQLALPWRKKKNVLWSLARIFILLSCPASAGIRDQKGIGQRTLENLLPILMTRADIQAAQPAERADCQNKDPESPECPSRCPRCPAPPQSNSEKWQKRKRNTEVTQLPVLGGGQSDVTEFAKCVTKWGNVYQFVYF